MADNKMEKSIKEAIGKSLNEFNKRIGMAKLIKDNKNQDRILKGILSQVNDENIEKTEKSNVITLDNSTDGIVELQEIKGDTNVNVSKMEKETPITHVIDDKNGNVISLDGITEGAINIDDIEGNTMVNCNKDTDKELILMPNLDTNGYSNVTTTEGIDGGKVDISLEGNTMVNVCDQEDPIAITKSYEVTTGNHIALQGEYDGKCRPNIYGNTMVNLALDKDTYSSKNGASINNNIKLAYNLKAGVTYTLIRTISEFSVGAIQESINFYDMSFYTDGTYAQDHNSKYYGNGQYVSTFTPTKDIVNMQIIIGMDNIDKDNGIYPTITISDYMILEGDYTNKPIPDYFTGMKSSFEDKLITDEKDTHNGKYKVDYKVTGKNLIAFTELGDILNKAGEDASSTTIMRTSYIFLKANHTYYITNPTVEGSEWLANIRYDRNKNFIGETYENNETITPKEDMYLRIKKHNPNQLPWQIQLEEGTTATTYEPYKESIKTLYLNSPLLEGDTIEQSDNNIIHNHRYGKVVLDGSNYEGWILHDNQSNDTSLIRFSIEMPSKKSGTFNIICDKMSISSLDGNFENINTECISGHPLTVGINIWIKKGKLSSVDVAGFKQYLQQNPITVVYELTTPTQEIISTNDNLLLDSYTNGHLDVDTIIPIDKVEFKNADIHLKYVNTNTEYTIQFESDNVGKVDIYNGSGMLRNINVTKGLNKVTITSDSDGYSGTNWSGIGFNASKIVVTPKVDNNFGYFKGMKSVGECEDNKIEILSQNKNLYVDCFEFGDIQKSTGLNSPSDLIYRTRDYMKVEPNTNYFFSRKFTSNWHGLYFYDVNKKYVGYNDTFGTKFVTPNNAHYIRYKFLFTDSSGDYIMQIEKGESITNYIEGKINKKEILLNEPLRSLPNGIKDKIVIIDGKWYIERNCVKITMDGNENWDTMSDDNYTRGWTTSKVGNNAKLNTSLDNKLISDKYTYIGNDSVLRSYKGEGCGETFYRDSFDKQIQIKIKNSKLQTVDINGFKQYLQSNNCDFIYQLAQPTYEPIDYNPLEVYTDTTHISNNSTIPCNMVIRNSGFNCILKPNTTYTVSSNNGLSTVTTKDSIGDSVLRFYDKDTTSITKMNKVLILEGDYVTGNPPIPAFFEGMESAFEQELVTDEKDEHYGKYKVNVKAVGKNLVNVDNIIIGYIGGDTENEVSIMPQADAISYIIPCLPNTTYVCYTTGDRTVLGSFSQYPINGMKCNVIGYVKITTGVNDRWLMAYVNSSAKINNLKVQIEQGTTATEYEPYKENNIAFYLNEPLRGVGDVKDKVYVKEDKVVVERNCGVYIYKGIEHWTVEEYGIKNFTKFVGYNFPNAGGEQCVSNLASYNIDKAGTSIRISPTLNRVVFINNYFEYISNVENRLQAFKEYLSNNNLNIVYQLATPVYEEIEYSNNRLTLNTYNNSTLFYDSNIPVSNTSFKPLWEELIYIKNSTTYYIQFNAVGNGNVVVNLGGTELTTTITEGYNKIEITTPNNSTNLLTIDGQGIKINKVVVSEALCGGYYKGLQSCFEEHMENGKYVCVIRGISLDGSKVNGIKFYLNEPLRGVGDIKDRLCIKDNKLMVERNCASITFDGSDDEKWYPTGNGGHATRNTFEINFADVNGCKGVTPSISNSFNYENTDKIPVNDNAFRTVTNAQNITYFLFTPSTDIIPYRNTDKWKKWLQQNPVTIVYQLATPVYEEIINEYGLPIILEGYENGIVYVDSSVTPTTSIKYTSNNKVPATLSNTDNLNTATQNDINNNIVTYMMDIDMMLTEMEMEDNASVMSLNNSDDNNQNHDSSYSNILNRMNKEDRIKYQDNTTKMLEKVIKGKSLTKEENINRIDLYLSEGKIRKEQSNYLKELLKGVE